MKDVLARKGDRTRLRGAFGGLCRRAVGWAPGAGQRTLDVGYALRQGVQVAAVR